MHDVMRYVTADHIGYVALCRAMDHVGDYWSDRTKRSSQNLFLLQGAWGAALADHYEGIASGLASEGEDIEKMAFDLGRADGFFEDETDFIRFSKTILDLRMSLPDFQVVRYKGGGFSCSSLS